MNTDRVGFFGTRLGQHGHEKEGEYETGRLFLERSLGAVLDVLVKVHYSRRQPGLTIYGGTEINV